MPLVRINAPSTPVVSLAEARAHLRTDDLGSPATHPDDDLIERLVEVATGELDGENGWLGRALVTQRWKLNLDCFPPGSLSRIYDDLIPGGTARIYLPLTSPQLGSPTPTIVNSVTYIDTDGTLTTLAASAYRVVSESDPVYLEPAYNTTWPQTRGIGNAVSIDYYAGYGAAADVPEPIRNYILARAGQFYELRELAVAGVPIAENPFMRHSLENFRMRGLTW